MSRSAHGARFPTELVTIDIATSSRPDDIADGPAMEIYAVADLASIVDGDALLRAAAPEEPPYWALIWIGARAIASRMQADPPPRGSRVLDVGCGLGLSGLAAAAAGAHVTFVDFVEEALDVVRASAARLGIDDGAYATRRLDFTRERAGERFDVVLAADVVYEPASYEPLAAFLDDALAPDGTLWLTETLRADARRVLDLLVARGLTLDTEGVWVREDARPERTWLHRLRR